MIAGRDFTEAELTSDSGERVAIDDVLAERLWPGENALGRQIQFRDADDAPGSVPKGNDAKQPIQVVGIIPAVKHSFGDPQPSAHVHAPLGQHYESSMMLQLRVAEGVDERTMLDTITRAVRDVDERLPVVTVATWRDHLDNGFEMWLIEPAPRCSRCSAASRCSWRCSASTASSRTSSRGARASSAFGSRSAHSHAPGATGTARGRPHNRHRHRDRPGVGASCRAVSSRLPAGVNAAEPLVLVIAPLILLGASLLLPRASRPFARRGSIRR